MGSIDHAGSDREPSTATLKVYYVNDATERDIEEGYTVQTSDGKTLHDQVLSSVSLPWKRVHVQLDLMTKNGNGKVEWKSLTSDEAPRSLNPDKVLAYSSEGRYKLRLLEAC
eukprot:GHVU01135307.1.p1 GENE.GHVU01135307.1~~GHVU01135307.1.p1  ORF type:complete len:112 (-),score=9.68 GHVU01135307.1:866-1201(-)